MVMVSFAPRVFSKSNFQFDGFTEFIHICSLVNSECDMTKATSPVLQVSLQV